MFGDAGNSLLVAFRAVVWYGRKMASVVALAIALSLGGRVQHDLVRGAADVPPIRCDSAKRLVTGGTIVYWLRGWELPLRLMPD
jgi:hypothetical protein